MSTEPDVVITGVGATTPLGGDAASTWEAALAGKSGIRTLDNDWAEKYGIPVTFAGTLAVPPAETLSRPETKRMDPSAQYAIVAAREAWADAGSPRDRRRAPRRGRRVRHRRHLDRCSTAGTPCGRRAPAASCR